LNLQYLRRELPRFAGEVERLGQFLERLGEARHGADRVSTIVRDLRAFSRVDHTPRGPTDLRRVLSSALKVAAPELANRARIVEDYAQVPLVEGDASRLEQVFLNLVVNAAQALNGQDPEHDEIRVTLRAEEPARVVVEVSDNGAGIAPDVLDRVFDPFFSTKPIGVGTGLGLPICHSIVTSLGGDIRVQSELGRGTTFRVTLPALAAADHRPAYLPTPMPSLSERSRSRVLVVDDELPLASMLSRVLADDHAVRITSSAREALEILLGSEEFDLVLCDLLMPGMSGMDLYRELREQRPGLERRLVFMTGGAFTPRASDFLASVPNARIEKPFDLKQVRRLVREIERALTR
jgi:CheY-like chemotaxis protein/two-component sensor histidine kinase